MPPPGIKPVILHFLSQCVYLHYIFTVKASSCQFIGMLLMWKVSGSVFLNLWTVNISLDDEAAAASDARVLSLFFQGGKKTQFISAHAQIPSGQPGLFCVCVCVCWQRGMVDLYSHSLFLFSSTFCAFSEARVRRWSDPSRLPLHPPLNLHSRVNVRPHPLTHTHTHTDFIYSHSLPAGRDSTENSCFVFDIWPARFSFPDDLSKAEALKWTCSAFPYFLIFHTSPVLLVAVHVKHAWSFK